MLTGLEGRHWLVLLAVMLGIVGTVVLVFVGWILAVVCYSTGMILYGVAIALVPDDTEDAP